MQSGSFGGTSSHVLRLVVLVIFAGMLQAQTPARETPRSGTADATTAEKGKAAADRESSGNPFQPKTLWERYFQVRYRDQTIGVARVELQSWHHGVTHVHEFERKLFSESGSQGDAHFWDIERHSESQGNVIRYWGNGHHGAINWQFSMQGRGTAARISRAWAGDVVDKKAHPAPDAYILYDRIRHWLEDNRDKTALTLGAEVPAWYVTPPGWVTLLIRPMGKDEVKTVEGPKVPAWRFRVNVAGAPPGVHAILWTDDDGRVLKKEIPFLALSYIPFQKAKHVAEQEVMDWPTAQNRFQFDSDSDAFLLDDLAASVVAGPTTGTSTGHGEQQEFAARMVLFDFGL